MFDIKIPSFFILFLTFLFIWVWNLKKNQKKYESSKNEFWSKEEKSLIVRKKEIPSELYFQPDISKLVFPEFSRDDSNFEKREKLINQIKSSLSLPMLSFKGVSNTDLRLTYGTANQTVIAQAEENYEAFLGFLYDYAVIMSESKQIEEAVAALEEIIRLASDSSRHYILLAKLYAEQGNYNAIRQLKEAAEQLEPISRHKVLQYFNQYNQFIS